MLVADLPARFRLGLRSLQRSINATRLPSNAAPVSTLALHYQHHSLKENNESSGRVLKRIASHQSNLTVAKKLNVNVSIHRWQHQDSNQKSFSTNNGKGRDGERVVEVCGRQFQADYWTNVTPRILSFVGKDLHRRQDHPLWRVRERIVKVI